MKPPNDTLQEKISEFGLGLQAVIHDGRIHRFTPDGDKSKCGWYVSYDNGDFQSGAFGCWKRDIKEGFCSVNSSSLSLEQKQEYARQKEEEKRLLSMEKINQQEYVKSVSNQRFNDASSLGVATHQYLLERGVNSYGLRSEGDLLLIPMYGADGELCSIQSINTEGEKRFAKGGRIKGCFYMLGTPNGVLILCEGYSTGASIHQATDEAVAICFNSGNLKEAAKELGAKHPNAKIIIAGDDDHLNEQNTGRIKAMEAAKHIGGTTVFPEFVGCDETTKYTDFNDLHRLCGLDEVKRQMYKSIRSGERLVNHESFVFYESFYKAMNTLPADDKVECIDAVCNYALYEKQTKLSARVQGLFELVKPQLDANIKKRKNGNKGGRPPKV